MDPPKPWVSFSALNCYTDATDGFKGGSRISLSTNPIVFPNVFLTLPECQQRCLQEAACTGFVMQDTYNTRPSCWLRKSIDIQKCSTHFRDFTTYLNPRMYPSTDGAWLSYGGVDCVTQAGASSELVPAEGSVPAGASIDDCQLKCNSKSACLAIQWRNEEDAAMRKTAKTCWLLTDVVLEKCTMSADTARYELRTPGQKLTPPDADTPAPATAEKGNLGSPWATRSGVLCRKWVPCGDDGVVKGHKSLYQCQAACLMETDCSAIVMHDTGTDASANNCILYKEIDWVECQENQAGYNVWVRPGNKAEGGAEWFSYAGTNCNTSAGADNVLDVSGHLDLSACEKQCRNTADCEALVWQDRQDTTSPNCYLRKNVKLSGCQADQAFNLRVMAKFLPTDPSPPPVAPPPNPAPSPPSPPPPAVPAPAPSLLKPWKSFAGKRCYAGKGGESISYPGHDPVQGHLSLMECQEKCVDISECVAIVMWDSPQGDLNNCWLFKNIQLEACEDVNAPTYNVWFKPWVLPTSTGEWLSYAGMNCHTGHGADDAIPHQGVRNGYLSLEDCEQRCSEISGCEGIVWRPMNDGWERSICYLRKHVKLAECEADPAFNLLVLSRFAFEYSEHPLGQKPWGTAAGKNCYALNGGESISAAGFDPMPDHQFLTHCQKACQDQLECEAVVMADTLDGLSKNCWLRKNVQLEYCADNADSNIWFKPGAGPADVDKWMSYSGTNCYPGHGAERAVPNEDVLPGHNNLLECQDRCLKVKGCEAIIWHDTDNSVDPNCYLRKDVKLSHCDVNEAFNLRILKKVATTHPLGQQPWGAVAGKSCLEGHGGEIIEAAGFDPMPDHKRLKQCQQACQSHPDCQAIVMSDTKDGHTKNCWLIKNVQLEACVEDTASNIWFKPGVRQTTDDRWLSYGATNCYEAHGAERAVPTEDAAPMYRTLLECQDRCVEVEGCEAIIWHDTKNSVAPRCYLRKKVNLAECEVDADFNLRVLNKDYREPVKPWPSVAGVACNADSEGDQVSVSGFNMSLTACQKQCASMATCDAFFMFEDAHTPNCVLRKNIRNIRVRECAPGGYYTTWFKPGVRQETQDRWVSYAGTNCYTGHGAERAVPAEDMATERLWLEQCQDQCLQVDGCEAIVWQEPKDDEDYDIVRARDSANCALLKSVRLAECVRDEKFNLRVLNPQFKGNAIPEPWPTTSSAFCYSRGKVYRGGKPLSKKGFDPVPGYQDLVTCQLQCEAQPECQGFVMVDIDEDSADKQGNCWLFSDADVRQCVSNANANAWFKPGSRPVDADKWEAYAGLECNPGRGADFAVPGQDLLHGHMLLKECEQNCQRTPGCEAILFLDTDRPHQANCGLRKNIKPSECEEKRNRHMRILREEYKEVMPVRRATIEGWLTLASTRCESGAGAEALDHFYQPTVHVQLSTCQQMCLIKDSDCAGIVMLDTKDADTRNCFLVKNVNLDKCVRNDTHASFWFNPDYHRPAKGDWVSYPARNCFPGAGAVWAVENQDVLDDHKDQRQCQDACEAVAGCEAFVWRDTLDSETSNCYLRKQIDLAKCDVSHYFNVQVRYGGPAILEMAEDGETPLRSNLQGAANGFGLVGSVVGVAGLVAAAGLSVLVCKRRTPTESTLATRDLESDSAGLVANAH